MRVIRSLLKFIFGYECGVCQERYWHAIDAERCGWEDIQRQEFRIKDPVKFHVVGFHHSCERENYSEFDCDMLIRKIQLVRSGESYQIGYWYYLRGFCPYCSLEIRTLLNADELNNQIRRYRK